MIINRQIYWKLDYWNNIKNFMYINGCVLGQNDTNLKVEISSKIRKLKEN